MAEIMGVDCILARNSGSYGSPTWSTVSIARDVSLNMERKAGDTSKRGGGGHASELVGNSDTGVEFEVIYDPTDTQFIALQAAYMAKTVVEFAIANGTIATTGTNYLRAHFQLHKFSRTEPLDDASKVSCMIKVAPNANATPIFVTT